MKKRVLAVFTAAVMLCQILGALPVLSAEETELLPEGFIVKDTFDGARSAFTVGGSWVNQNVITDEDGENFLETVNSGSGADMNGTLNYPTVTFSDDENIQTVSMDLKFDKVDYYGNILIRTGVWSMVYSILGDGHIVASGNRQTAVKDTLPSFEYEADKWYTFSMVVDRAAKKATFYADGIAYGSQSFGNWSSNITILFERSTGEEGEPNTMYIDNMVFGYDEAFVPYREDCALELICEELGQAFWEKAVEFEVGVENTTDVKRAYDVNIELVNDLKISEYTKDEVLELAPGERKIIEVKTDVSRFAVYSLNITSVDKETGDSYSLETELVTIKKSEVQNPMHAIQDHAIDSGDGFGRYPEKFAALKNAGMSGVRSSLYWQHYETAPGAYKVPEKYIEGFEVAKENDLDWFFVVGYNNEAVVPGEMPPSSPHGIAAYAEFAHHLTLDTKQWSAGYEIYNEWNVLDHFNRDQLSGAQYVDLIKPTYARIKAANPEAKVYGLSGMTWNRTELYKQMAEEMFENGVADYCDGFSIHSYKGYQSPDTGAHIEGLDYTRGLMEQYGAGDKELIITEMGWQAVNSSPEEVATWIVKYAAMIHNRVDRIYWYCSQRKIRDVGAGEQSYGWMQDENETADYVPYAPLPQLRAISNYNSYIAASEKTDEIEIPDGDAVFHRFKRTDGKEVLMAWIKDGSEAQNFAVNLGVASAVVSDIYGNERKYTTADGKLHIRLTNAPQYIIGNFGELSAEKSDNSISATEMYVATEDSCVFSVVKDNSLKNVKVELELPDGLKVSENKGFKGNTAEIVIETGETMPQETAVVVKLMDKTGEKLYYATEALIKRTDKCKAEVLSKFGLDGRWKIGISLKNMKRQGSISGKAVLAEPVFNDGETVEFSFSKLEPQGTITKYIYIPDSWSDAVGNVKCSITLENGENFEIEERVNFNGIVYTNQKPVIDGVVSEKEWNKTMSFNLNSESNRPKEVETVWDGTEDLNGKFYYNWDRDNLYIAAEVTDNVLCDSAENKTWQNDGIQIAFALGNSRNDARTELGLSLLGGEEVFERTSWIALGASGLGNIQDDGDFGDTEYKIRRDGNMTYYEMKIPWEEIVDENFDILDYDGLYMSILLNDNDGAGRRGWLESCPGIGYLKTALTFEKVKIFR